jgi:spermidine/putrescine transport system ATP-binding protein
MIYRGDHVDLFVEPGPLRVRTEPTPGLCVGAELWLHLHPEHLEALVD